MTQADYNEFKAAMEKAALALDVQLTSAKIAIYFEDLADFPIEAVVHGLAKARREQVYAGFPKVAEIRRHVEGTVQDRAELAWRTFCQICTEHGHYPSLQVTDGAMAFAIEHMGGWVTAQAKLAEAGPEMLRAHENQFKASYKLGQARNESGRYFAGQFEAHNRTATYQPGRDEIKQPVLMVRADKFLALSVPFDLRTGQLSEFAQNALKTGGNALAPYLPLPAPKKMNPAPVAREEMASPEDVAAIKQQIREMAGGRRLLAAAAGADAEEGAR